MLLAIPLALPELPDNPSNHLMPESYDTLLSKQTVAALMGSASAVHPQSVASDHLMPEPYDTLQSKQQTVAALMGSAVAVRPRGTASEFQSSAAHIPT